MIYNKSRRVSIYKYRAKKKAELVHATQTLTYNLEFGSPARVEEMLQTYFIILKDPKKRTWKNVFLAFFIMHNLFRGQSWVGTPVKLEWVCEGFRKFQLNSYPDIEPPKYDKQISNLLSSIFKMKTYVIDQERWVSINTNHSLHKIFLMEESTTKRRIRSHRK
jgi:hypothetical protein